jgi:molybdopterin-synthase adenylyltransferase
LLTSKEVSRYSRNILLSSVGRKGQEKLKSSIVTVVGAGGLGSPTLLYLAAAGVGEIRIIDSDQVDLTNLQRQILFTEESITEPKVYEARKQLQKLNPNIEIKTYFERLVPENIKTIFENSNLVIEGSDNFETKFLVNDACYFLNIPILIAGIFQFEGQVMGIKPKKTQCYRCVFHSMPEEYIPNCSDVGVLGSMAGIIGSILATESIKHLLSLDDSIFKNLLSFDSMSLEMRKISLKKNKNCPLCGSTPSIHGIKLETKKHCEV